MVLLGAVQEANVALRQQQVLIRRCDVNAASHNPLGVTCPGNGQGTGTTEDFRQVAPAR